MHAAVAKEAWHADVMQLESAGRGPVGLGTGATTGMMDFVEDCWVKGGWAVDALGATPLRGSAG